MCAVLNVRLTLDSRHSRRTLTQTLTLTTCVPRPRLQTVWCWRKDESIDCSGLMTPRQPQDGKKPFLLLQSSDISVGSPAFRPRRPQVAFVVFTTDKNSRKSTCECSHGDNKPEPAASDVLGYKMALERSISHKGVFV